MLPTLFIPGSLQSPDGRPETKVLLDSIRPIDHIVEWFTSRRTQTGVANRVLVLKSATASGKSTVVPAMLYRDFVRPQLRPGEQRGLIITQPRILTAIANIKEMMKHESNRSFLRLGHTIGWSTGANKLQPEAFGLLSCTVGTLTQQLRTMTDEEFIEKYRVVLIDETHERDVQTDLTIMLMKSLVARNSHLQQCPFFVLMSATFDPAGFLAYFGLQAATNYIYCVGSSFPRKEFWPEKTVANYLTASAKLAWRLHVDHPDDTRGDILVFLPGLPEIRAVGDMIEKRAKDAKAPPVAVLRIDGDAIRGDSRDYRMMFSAMATRRIILSTNVAETGLTLDDLKYVIDGGYNRETEFNPVHGLDSLLTKPAPLSRIIQRRGRCGRKFPGEFYPLYPQWLAEQLPKNQLPQILLADFSQCILDCVHEQLRATGQPFDPWRLDMVDPPSPDAIRCALEKAYALGLIASPSLAEPVAPAGVHGVADVALRPGLGLTPLGAVVRCAFSSTVSMETARMVLSGFTWGVSVLDLVSLGAWLAAADSASVARRTEATEHPIDWDLVYRRAIPKCDGVRAFCGDDFFDLLCLHHATFAAYDLPADDCRRQLRDFCEIANINVKTVFSALGIRESMIETMLQSGVDCFRPAISLADATPEQLPDLATRLKLAVYDGFRMNLLTRGPTGYTTRRGLLVPTVQLRTQGDRQRKERAWLDQVAVRHLLYYSLAIKEPRAESGKPVGPSKVKCGLTCVLDGFVAPDLDFI